MKEDIRNLFWSIGIGVALVTYAHNYFATRSEFNVLINSVDRLEKKLDKIIIRGFKDE